MIQILKNNGNGPFTFFSVHSKKIETPESNSKWSLLKNPFPSRENSFNIELQEVSQTTAFLKDSINCLSPLYIIRGERGGAISYFLDKNYMWDEFWYDNPEFEKIHSSQSIFDLFKEIKSRNIDYIITHNNEDLKRYFFIPYKNDDHPQLLPKIILQNEYSGFLKRINKNKMFVVFKVI